MEILKSLAQVLMEDAVFRNKEFFRPANIFLFGNMKF